LPGRTVVVACTVLMTGCTVFGAFTSYEPDYSLVPEQALREVALEIERAVQRGDRDATFADRGGIVVNDEVILQAIRARASRSHLVNRLLDQGFAEERPDGTVYILRSGAYKEATTSRQRDINALVIGSEADSRWQIYEGIVKAGGLPRKALGAVQRVFYEARLQCMRPGQKYRTPDGETAVIQGK